MTAVDVKRWTVDEFKRLPQGPPYYELEDGELIEMASPKVKHQRLNGKLFAVTDQYCTVNSFGVIVPEVDVYLPDAVRVYVPDLVFLATEHAHYVWEDDDDKIHGAPDLVVEILSDDERRDRVEKFRAYYTNGVLWYWIINPATLEIEEYEAGPTGYVLRSTTLRGQTFTPGVFPGLSLDLAALLV